MAFQPINNLQIASVPNYAVATTALTANAAGESCGIIGRVRIEGNAGSKTISAAGGGAIYWTTGTVTFADAGSTLRVGIQDVDLTTGLEDGTFDVNVDYTGGGGGVTANALNKSVMGAGTKTLAHGDLIAIVVELSARGGADAIQIARSIIRQIAQVDVLGIPYGTADTGTLAKQTGTMLYAVIEFDDGTIGWIQGTNGILAGTPTALSFNSGSSPDEYIGTFTPDVPLQISGFAVTISAIAAADTFEAILYEDPYGTPNALVTVTPDTDVQGSAASTESLWFFSCAATDLSAGTTYGVAIRPTTTNPLSWEYLSLGTGGAPLKSTLPLPALKMAGRTDQTGAFVETDVIHMPLIILDVCGLSDGSGGGGGASAYAFA